MKVFSPLLSIGLALFLLASGCSGEEQNPPANGKPKVARPIVMPDSKSEEEIKGGLKKTAQPLRNTVKESAAVVPEAKREKASPKPLPAEAPETIEKDAGLYIVKKGESLALIAGKKEVYGDPMKWPILCRYTMDKLGPLATGTDFPEKELPEGLRLKVVGPEKAKENLSQRDGFNWAVNVQSATNSGEILPATISLLKEGFPVYLTRVKVKGKDWMRLRVGFSKSRAEAENEGEKIKMLLNFDDLWVTKVGELEFKEFAGY